jgi:xylulokinase
MLLLGIDIGTSSVKVSVVDSHTQQSIASAQYPDTEAPIVSKQTGWAEQSPLSWWEFLKVAIQKANATSSYDPKDIVAVGIAYQMHGLVVVDKDGDPLRDSIIWCDSRAVPYGDAALKALGGEYCLQHLLNSPGNFTAAKLAWVKENEPALYEKIYQIMLPGDFIALKLTGAATTSISALSEGIFWDFEEDKLSQAVLEYFGFDSAIIPQIADVFSNHGTLLASVAETLGLKAGIPVSYKAGDQPNNALSLNVLNPGEVAATAGTSGVIYAVSDELSFDPQSRVNTFAHVNYTTSQKRLGTLLCINGTGILNSWLRKVAGASADYKTLNEQAAAIALGSDELYILPFGNGAERMLNNRLTGAQISHIDLNKHTPAHLYRAGQEGIAFAFRYGLDIMRENKIQANVIRAGKANMFLSSVFAQAFVDVTQTPVELYNCDGSVGAAIGAGIGAKVFNSSTEAFMNAKPVSTIVPNSGNEYEHHYNNWKELLEKQLNN